MSVVGEGEIRERVLEKIWMKNGHSNLSVTSV